MARVITWEEKCKQAQMSLAGFDVLWSILTKKIIIPPHKMEKVSCFPHNYVFNACFSITKRCNFVCPHCYRGEAKKEDMAVDEILGCLDKAYSPFLSEVTLYGGEARLHPQFRQITTGIRQFFNDRGTTLMSEIDERTAQEKYDHDKLLIIDSLGLESESYSKEDLNVLSKRGELRAMIHRGFSQLGISPISGVTLELYTNGFGMSDPAHSVDIMNDLYGQGVSTIWISLDPGHVKYSRNGGPKVNYKFIRKLMELPEKKRESIFASLGLSEGLMLLAAGSGPYILPIGRGKFLSEEDRLELARSDPHEPTKSIEWVEETLATEFYGWEKIFGHPGVLWKGNGPDIMSNCHCGVAVFYRQAEEIMNSYKPENRFHGWSMYIEPGAKVSRCNFNILPSIGNLHDSTATELYEQALSSKLYEMIAHKGPQGVARKVARASERGVNYWFRERGACGICEDLMAEYPEKMMRLMDEKSSWEVPQKRFG